MGVFRGSKNKKSGKCNELPRIIFLKPRWGGGLKFYGSKFSKFGKFHGLPRKSIHFFNPPGGEF